MIVMDASDAVDFMDVKRRDDTTDMLDLVDAMDDIRLCALPLSFWALLDEETGAAFDIWGKG